MKRPFSLTLVEYEEGDPLGFVFAAISLAPMMLFPISCLLTLWTRKVTFLGMTLGILVNEVLNIVLKGLFLSFAFSQRPENAHRKDGGFPSDHSQFMGFFAVYSVLVLMYRWNAKMNFQYLLRTILYAAAALVAASRVYLGYHTVFQVFSGLLIGALVANGWGEAVLRLLGSGPVRRLQTAIDDLWERRVIDKQK